MDRLECDRMFVAVLDTGSFAAASRLAGVSSGQASKLVARLEAELGVQLIKRTTRALAATEAGLAYFERIKALLVEFDTLDASVRNASAAPAGRLRLSAPLSFGTVQLTPVLLGFARAYPAIQLDVSFSDRVVNLVDEGFDAAVRIGWPSDSSLISRTLCEARIVLAAAPAYLAQHGHPAAPADLAGHHCIVDTNFRDPETWQFQTEAGPVAIPVQARLRFSGGQACVAAAEAGLGIARVPSFIAGPRIQAGALRPLLTQVEDAPARVFVLYPPARHLAAKVRALADCLAAAFRGTPEWEKAWSD